VLPPCEHLRCTMIKSEVGEYPACPTSSWFDVRTPTKQYQLASTATLGNSALSRTAQRLTVPSAVKDTSGRLRTRGFGLPPMPLVGADPRPQMIHTAHRRGTSRPKMKMPQHSVRQTLWSGRRQPHSWRWNRLKWRGYPPKAGQKQRVFLLFRAGPFCLLILAPSLSAVSWALVLPAPAARLSPPPRQALDAPATLPRGGPTELMHEQGWQLECWS
jgi:hypothetical protein